MDTQATGGSAVHHVEPEVLGGKGVICIGSLLPDSESLGTKAYIYKDCKMSAKSVKFVGVGVSRPANLSLL